MELSPAVREKPARNRRPISCCCSRFGDAKIELMILINLLPHREQKRIARRREFYFLAAFSFAAAVLFIFAVGIVISEYISSQAERNRFIASENQNSMNRSRKLRI